MSADSPQHIFSSPDIFDSGSSCVYQLHTSSTLIIEYIVEIKSLINCTVSIFTRNPSKSKILHITDIDSSENLSKVQINHMEDVFIVAKSQGKNAIMSLIASVRTSLKGNERGSLSKENNYGENSNYNSSSKENPLRNT